VRDGSLCTLLGCAAVLSGCATEPVFCADVLTAVTVTVRNGAGQSLGDLTVTDTVRRSGAVLHLVGGAPGDTLPAAGVDHLPIATNEFRDAFLRAGDEVVVVVAAGGRAGSGLYRLASDGCFVTKLAGPDTLTVR
jgi:hypothetical protein